MKPDSAAHALALVRERGGPELAERLERLDALTGERPALRSTERPAPPDDSSAPEWDVALAGGGLSLLIAPLLAARGLRVAVFERARAGTSHREWNCAADELAPLWESGLLDRAQVEELVVCRYRHGVCRWHGGGEYRLTDALDHAVDARALMTAVRARALALGVAVFDGHSVLAERGGRHAVRFSGLEAEGRSFESTARILLDARGAASPWAAPDLTCPTVGGVLTGLEVGEDAPDRVDPSVGEILVTTEGVESGRQHIWEAFPGRPGETTVYLFAYEPASARRPGDLARLYGRFFERLPTYKRGSAQMLRPTFGHIPGWSRRHRGSRTDHPRIVLVGDAAARHSPLTFCGFGSMLRTFRPIASGVAAALEAGTPPRALWPDEPIHALTGALASVMARPSRDPERAGALNLLLDTAFRRLRLLGDDATRDLIRDRLDPRTFLRFVTQTAGERPEVYRAVASALGPAGAASWGIAAAARALRSP